MPSSDAGDAEVGQLRFAEVRQEQVLGLDVAVHDPGPVRRLEGAGDLDGGVDGFGPCEPTVPLEPVGHAALGQVGHREVGAAVGGCARVEDGDDLGVSRDRPE